MTFFQILVTDEFNDALNIKYTSVSNFATLTKAMRAFNTYNNYPDQEDGVTFIEEYSGRDMCQFHLNYEENGSAVIELRYEYFGIPEGCSTKQTVSQRSVYLKEVTL